MTVSQFPARPGVEPDLPDARRHRQELAWVLNLAMQGHLNSSLSVTLDTGSATTTVTDSRISAQTCASFMPTTANAAAEVPTLYAVCTNGTMTINHTNSATTGRTFTVGLVG